MCNHSRMMPDAKLNGQLYTADVRKCQPNLRHKTVRF